MVVWVEAQRLRHLAREMASSIAWVPPLPEELGEVLEPPNLCLFDLGISRAYGRKECAASPS